MKAYIISIAAAAVISAAMSMITPAKWSKYVGIVTGMAVVICIAQPLLELMHTNVFEEIEYNTSQSEVSGNFLLTNEIEKELKKRIEEDAQLRLKNEFRVDCSVEADISVNGEGQITGVERMTVRGGNIDSAAVGRLREIYGVKDVKYGGR